MYSTQLIFKFMEPRQFLKMEKWNCKCVILASYEPYDWVIDNFLFEGHQHHSSMKIIFVQIVLGFWSSPCFSSLAYALSFSPLDIDIISIFRHNTDSDRIAKSNHMDVALCQLYFVFLFVVPSNLWETQSIQSKLAVRNSHNRARVVDHRRISALWISDKR